MLLWYSMSFVLAFLFHLPGCLWVSSPHPVLPHEDVGSVFYDNDEVIDVYTDDYIMALASMSHIRLVGMSTSTSMTPYNRWVTSSSYEEMLRDRSHSVSLARGMGWRHIPDAVLGPNVQLVEPSSGMIEDTQPISSAGSWLLVHEVQKAAPENPLVLVMGGPLTLAADAYLLDPSIADRIVVYWLGGSKDDMGDYNGWADGWAAYIVLHRLRLIQFPASRGLPSVPKWRLKEELPAMPLTRWMIDKQLNSPTIDLPGNFDGDGPPAVTLMRPDYLLDWKRVSFSHWGQLGDYVEPHAVPVFKDDPQGKAIVVTRANAELATEEWWRALREAMTSPSGIPTSGKGLPMFMGQTPP